MFFKYIEHEHDELAECFFSGIVCRYWGYAGRIYVQCERHIPFEECHDCIIDAIRYVLSKRVWEKPTSSLYQDPTGPDKAIHIAMKRQKAIMLAKHNAQKRVSNFNTLSIDKIHEEYNDAADGMFTDIADDGSDVELRRLISMHFTKTECLEGIILDMVCYNRYSYYDVKNVIKKLRKIDESCYDYYRQYYSLSKELYLSTLKDISNMSNQYLRIKINSILWGIKKGLENND